jgi:beta-galactosidase/beta-glucuronidase
MITQQLPKGETVIHGELQITNPRLWDLHDPFLYQVRARVNVKSSSSFDEQTIRTGFRDFRIENGHFRLNGRRIYLQTAHTGQQDPFGLRVPFDPDWPLADLRMMKAMGFNSIRFFQSLGLRKQLDLADELGFLIYEEPRGGWLIDYAADIYEQRRDRSIRAMIQRDRNHPSVVAWGLLNESPFDLSKNHPTFIHARESLALIRSMDPNRLVFLSSGRWDGEPDIGSVANPGVSSWQHLLGSEAEGAAAITPLFQPGGPWLPPPALPIAGHVAGMGDVHI